MSIVKERIIVASGLNGTELQRSAALHGAKMIGVRVMNPAELAQFALARCGRSPKRTLITPKDAAALIWSFLTTVKYFENASYGDAVRLVATLDTVRRFLPENEAEELTARLTGGEFPEKNAALLEVYERYRALCERHSLMDSVDLLREGLKAEPVDGMSVEYLREAPLLPLEESLANALSRGTLKKLTAAELYGAKEGTLECDGAIRGYGVNAELEAIIAKIAENRWPLDRCVIALTGTEKYAPALYDLSLRYDIPMTFGCGVPVLCSNPAALLSLWHTWQTSGHHGIAALSAMLDSPAMDTAKLWESAGLAAVKDGTAEKDYAWNECIKTKHIIDLAGSLGLGSDAAENTRRINEFASVIDPENDARKCRLVSYTRAFARQLEGSCGEFLARHTKRRPGSPDESALSGILSRLNAYERYAGGKDVGEILPYLTGACAGAQCSGVGTLHVVRLETAAAVLKEHLFIAGLSSDRFPGMPVENYLMLDDDWRRLPESRLLPTSEHLVTRRTELLEQIVSAMKGMGGTVHLSYSDYDTAELKDANPSSALYRLTVNGGPAANAAEEAELFQYALAKSAPIARAYADGENIVRETPDAAPEFEPLPGTDPLSRKWSPTAIGAYLECPLHFYYKYILGIDPQDPDDPLQIINTADLGTLVHACMEKLGAEPMELDAFLKYARGQFEDFLKKRPPVLPDAAKRKWEKINSMLTAAHEQDRAQPHTVLQAEVELDFETPEGIILMGRPDRVEETKDGVIVVDYKTNRKTKHEINNPTSCAQGLLYCYMLENRSGMKPDGCEFRYVRRGSAVPCPWNAETRQVIKDMLSGFRNSLEHSEYIAKSGDACTYCPMDKVCTRRMENGYEQPAEQDIE